MARIGALYEFSFETEVSSPWTKLSLFVETVLTKIYLNKILLVLHLFHNLGSPLLPPKPPFTSYLKLVRLNDCIFFTKANVYYLFIISTIHERFKIFVAHLKHLYAAPGFKHPTCCQLSYTVSLIWIQLA
jgi:hypothetical protein